MAVVESIYTPTLKDVVSGVRQTRFIGIFASTSAAAAGVPSSTTFTVPPDTARFITGWSAVGTPGAGQTIDNFQLILSISGSLAVFASSSPFFRTAATPTSMVFPCDLIALPGEVISLQGLFSAGGVANAISGGIWGFDIPRANLSA